MVCSAHVCLFMSVNSILFRSPSLWDKFDIDCILGKGNQLFKFIVKFKYLGMEDLPQDILIVNAVTMWSFLKIRQEK